MKWERERDGWGYMRSEGTMRCEVPRLGGWMIMISEHRSRADASEMRIK